MVFVARLRTWIDCRPGDSSDLTAQGSGHSRSGVFFLCTNSTLKQERETSLSSSYDLNIENHTRRDIEHQPQTEVPKRRQPQAVSWRHAKVHRKRLILLSAILARLPDIETSKQEESLICINRTDEMAKMAGFCLRAAFLPSWRFLAGLALRLFCSGPIVRLW